MNLVTLISPVHTIWLYLSGRGGGGVPHLSSADRNWTSFSHIFISRGYNLNLTYLPYFYVIFILFVTIHNIDHILACCTVLRAGLDKHYNKH